MSKNEIENQLIKSTSMFDKDAGAGMEEADKNSFAIPFIAVLQGLSPQLEKIEGAKPGLFVNTVTNELYKEVKVIPCAYQRRFLRWASKENGGGFKGEYSPIEVETNKLQGLKQTENGHFMIDGDELKDTRNHFVLALSSSGVWQPALISLTSTQIKKSKRWMSRIQGIELKNSEGKTFSPPSFSHIYTLKSVKEENSKGSWWGIDVDLDSMVQNEETYAKARAFYKSVSSGEIEVQMPNSVNEVAGETSTDNDKF